MLRRFGARVHVIGHTPGDSLRAAYDGALLMVNTFPFGAEMLLLVRDGEGYARWRIRSAGPPERW